MHRLLGTSHPPSWCVPDTGAVEVVSEDGSQVGAGSNPLRLLRPRLVHCCEPPPVPWLFVMAAPVWTDRQQAVLDAVRDGVSVVVLGQAGTGKSALIREIRRTGGGTGSGRVVLAAPTALAAVNIGATATVHRWAGIGIAAPGPRALPADKEAPYLQAACRHVYEKLSFGGKKNIKRVRTLIIDECSFMSAYLLEVLSYVMSKVRENPEPFGGVQVVLFGDARQLPPVHKRGEHPVHGKFFFEWSRFCVAFPEVIVLDKVFRQESDAFKELLGRAAIGELNGDDEQELRSRIIADPPDDVTRMFGTNDRVGAYNAKKLAEIKADPRTFRLVNKSDKIVPTYVVDNYISSHIADSVLTLKPGALVMCVANIPALGVYNGMLGRVVGFTADGYPRFVPREWEQKAELDAAVRAAKKKVELTSKQKREADIEDGKIPEDSYRSDEDSGPIKVFESDDEGDSGLSASRKRGAGEDAGSGEKRPRIVLPEVILEPHEWVADDYASGGQVRIQQVPLKLAWAFTIHKTQGMQLTAGVVSLTERDCFCLGSGYVVLSRFTSIAGLYLTAFEKKAVRADPRAVAFYESLNK